MRKNQIIRFFPNTDLRNAHEGLGRIAKENKINVQKLEPGEFVMFLNTSATVLKIYCSNNIICHLKSPDNRRLSLNAIWYLPNTFNGKAFDYDKALKDSLEEMGLKEVA